VRPDAMAFVRVRCDACHFGNSVMAPDMHDDERLFLKKIDVRSLKLNTPLPLGRAACI